MGYDFDRNNLLQVNDSNSALNTMETVTAGHLTLNCMLNIKPAYLLLRHQQQVHKGREIPDAETWDSQQVQQDCRATRKPLLCLVGEGLTQGLVQNPRSTAITLTEQHSIHKLTTIQHRSSRMLRQFWQWPISCSVNTQQLQNRFLRESNSTAKPELNTDWKKEYICVTLHRFPM